VRVPAAAAWALLGALVAVELALAAGVALGSTAAAYAAAALMVAFAAALAAAIATGRAGRPCPCFGSRSRVGWRGVARNLALAGGFVAVPHVDAVALSADAWLALGLAVALAAAAVLAVAVLALAREVGALRLQLPGHGALEIASEGPPVGERTTLLERFALVPARGFGLAVFTSPACPLCRSLEPAVDALARDPLVAVERFDEERDADVWRELEIPGSPFAVALDAEGTVRAKGTFNSYAQLESVLAAAERRVAAAVVAGSHA
jgi:hypothetical protein